MTKLTDIIATLWLLYLSASTWMVITNVTIPPRWVANKPLALTMLGFGGVVLLINIWRK